MIRVMIADDEQIVREGIEFILKKSFPEVTVVAMAGSGREAVECFEETRPNLVFMDIQMPGINGIDAMEMIRETDRQVKFVIVSAYEQFEYAKKAVQLGVEEYILKPINRKNMEAVTSKVIREIHAERAARQREMATQEKLDKILPVLEHGYIYSIIMNTDYREEQASYHQLLDINPVYAFMMVIELGDGDSPKALTNKIGIGIKGDRAYSSIRQTIKFKCKAVVGPMMVNRIGVLVYEDTEEGEYAQRVRAVELAETIAERVEALTGSQVYIGVGSCCGLDRINVSYNEAVRTLSKMTDEKVLHIKDAIDEKNKAFALYGMKIDEEAVVRKVEEGDAEAVEKHMRQFFLKLQKARPDNLDLLKRVATELMVLVHAVGYRNDGLTAESGSAAYIDEIAECHQPYELVNRCILKALAITEAIQGEKAKRVSGVIEEAMHYIDLHYNQDLRLKDVAEKVAISPQYFSRIFKKEVGTGFIDYLTQVRIDKAKTMLKAGHMSIKEICYEIGYNDPNYFSRLFKKSVGRTPSEYIRE